MIQRYELELYDTEAGSDFRKSYNGDLCKYEDAQKLEQENERLRALIVRLEPAVLPYDRCTSHGMVKTNYKNMREGILDALLKLKDTGNEN